VRCLGTALESGDKSPHSKRKSTKKDCFGDKIANFAGGFVLLVFLIDSGQALLCAFGLLDGGDRGLKNPCPPLNPTGIGGWAARKQGSGGVVRAKSHCFGNGRRARTICSPWVHCAWQVG